MWIEAAQRALMGVKYGMGRTALGEWEENGAAHFLDAPKSVLCR